MEKDKLIEVGEYVRTENGIIAKLTEKNIKLTNQNIFYLDEDLMYEDVTMPYEEKVVKHSKNIIDLIEAGDFVNGYKVISVDYDVLDNTTECIELDLNNAFQYQFISINQIKEILTKQQYNANKFVVESED